HPSDRLPAEESQPSKPLSPVQTPILNRNKQTEEKAERRSEREELAEEGSSGEKELVSCYREERGRS
ncbi:hypothetical protein LINGRAHAP2_LOCUS28153, partial [Linum grandiflorum]